MKTKLLFLSMFIVMMCMANPNTEDLSLEGKFLSQQNISYKIYQLSADSSAQMIGSRSGTAGYSVKLTAGIQYVLVFTSADGKVVKYLFVGAKVPCKISMDVDFKSDGSASLWYDGNRARITKINPSKLILSMR